MNVTLLIPWITQKQCVLWLREPEKNDSVLVDPFCAWPRPEAKLFCCAVIREGKLTQHSAVSLLSPKVFFKHNQIAHSLHQVYKRDDLTEEDKRLHYIKWGTREGKMLWFSQRASLQQQSQRDLRKPFVNKIIFWAEIFKVLEEVRLWNPSETHGELGV